MGGGHAPFEQVSDWPDVSEDWSMEYVNVPSSSNTPQTPTMSDDCINVFEAPASSLDGSNALQRAFRNDNDKIAGEASQITSISGDSVGFFNIIEANSKYLSSPFKHHGTSAVHSGPVSPTSVAFQLMEIVSDEQELSFVEKIQVSERQIMKLCNAIAPGSAKEKHGAITNIDFSALDAHGAIVIGFYGEKSIMSKVFRKSGLAPPDFIDKMDANRLQSGLYACLTEAEKLYLFYWDRREQQVEASRKDVSCNFVRYLVDLCDVVYICQDGRVTEEVSMKITPGLPSRKQRTQRLQISMRKESENDMRLLQGFKVGLPRSLCCNQTQLRIPQGLHRCIILAGSLNAPNLVTTKESKTDTAENLKAWLNSKVSGFSIDCTQLKDEEFVLLLEMLGRKEELTEHQMMEEKWKRRQGEADKKFQSSYAIIKAKKAAMVSVFHDALECFLMQNNPWEENLVQTSSSDMSSTASVLPTAKSFLPFESKLCSIWSDQDSQSQRFLYSGSKVQIASVNEKGEICAEHKLFSITVPNSGGKIVSGPICFGEQVMLTVHNTELGSSFCTEQCLASFSKADRNAFLKIEPIILDNDTKLVMKIQLKSGHSSELVVVRCTDDEEQGIKTWLNTLCSNPSMSLHPQAAALSHLISKSDKPLGDELLEKLLRESSLKAWPKMLPAQASALLVEHLSETQKEPTVIPEQVSRVCTQVYKAARVGLLSAVDAFLLKEIFPTMQENVEKKLHQERDTARQSQTVDANNFFLKMKSQFCVSNDETYHGNLKEKLKLKLLKLQHQHKSLLSRIFSDAKMTIQYSSEKHGIQTFTWQAVEMIPEKADLDELMRAPLSGRVVVPVCSKPVELITLNPKLESLCEVVAAKSGQVLLFVEAKDKSYLNLFYCPKLGVSMEGRNPIKSFKRGHDLWAFDEVSRFLALYERNICSIKAYRFDEGYQHMDWAGGDIQLSQYSGSSNLVWMELVPGKREILLVDDQNRLRVCELGSSMTRPRHTILPTPFIKACVTPDSSCLIVFTSQNGSSHIHKDGNDDTEQQTDNKQDGYPDEISCRVLISANVYLLDDFLTLLKSLPLDNMDGQNLEELHVVCKFFGTQMHLIFLSTKDKETVLMSHVVEISSAQQTFQLQKVQHKQYTQQTPYDTESNSQASNSVAMDYIFHVFDKYAISPPLCHINRSISFCILLKPPYNHWDSSRAKRNCEQHIGLSLQKLKEKGKVLNKQLLNLLISTETLTDSWHPDPSLRGSSTSGTCLSGLGAWIQRMLCLVPLQIARAENNALKPLVNGLQIPPSATYSDAVSLASLLRFGLYDIVLASWRGKVKVVSSMGKQSSGKSYLLNHLAGGLLDVAGGRCTDGVWLTIRCESDCLYVLLDFEGLGSFERSEQEDMFLSILNAAVSNVTIFNKRDFHLDKETEAIFQRFQDGVSLVKADEKLFKGLFYMAIKDVDASDVEDLKSEFFAKISHICSKSNENFLTTMYGGEAEIAALPPFQRADFQESINDIGSTIQETKASYNSGRRFMEDFKLVISQISTRDWSSVDSKRVALRLSILRNHLDAAIRFGQTGDGQCLLNFDNEEEIKDDLIFMEGISFGTVQDVGLELAVPVDSFKNVLEPLKQTFESFVQRQHGCDEKWHTMYQTFLVSLIARREVRVLDWLQVNTRDFEEDGDMQKLILETTIRLDEMKNRLQLCSSKCNNCFLKCVLEKGHHSDHCCLGSHACLHECSYCAEEQEGVGLMILECNDMAGHDGAHDCKRRTHTCEQPCMFSSKSSNCNINCSLRVNHQGDHRCKSLQHMCREQCSLPRCHNACAVPFEMGEHKRHACHEKICPSQCSMPACTRTCVTEDHFHDFEAGAEHFCSSEHPCLLKCESPGVCNVLTEVLKQTRSFHGKRSDFEYDYVSEQSEDRKGCCQMIPPFMRHHEGPHMHSTNANVVHFCNVRCPACDYYCQLPFGHAGLHKTVHGNMRKMKFVAEDEEIDVQDRKYVRGESGVAEMCMMHCKARGRGHTHLAPCPENRGVGCCTEKLYDEARHLQTRCAGLDVDVPLDEMTHQTYWEFIRFVDPCEETERETFALCDHFCRSDEHSTQSSNAGKSYCTEKLWHAPLPRSGALQTGAGGYVTEDGHHFTCNHCKISPHNVIFVMDKSGSMQSSDMKPTMSKFQSRQNNRLGCIFEAVLRFIKTRMQTTMTSGMQVQDSVSVILFDYNGYVSVKLADISEAIVDGLLVYTADGGTTYSSGLQLAENLLSESCKQPEIEKKGPVIVFLSDGGNNGGTDPVYMVQQMKQKEPRLVLHTIMFGHDPYANILQNMAKVGDGTFQRSLDEVQLARSFEDLAKSLKPKLAALCSSP